MDYTYNRLGKFWVCNQSIAILSIAFLLTTTSAVSQNVAIGKFEDHEIRVMQLQGKIPLKYSLTSRPFDNPKRFYDSLNFISNDSINQHWIVLPLSIRQKLTTHHPYGWSDGVMRASNGYQLQLSTGLFGRYKSFSFQINPELLMVSDSRYKTSSEYGALRFKAGARLFPGQSYLQVKTGKLAFRVSTENLWWGPGIRDALIMSNNAPGFAHLSFNTNEPVSTPIGTFEWQLIAGRLNHGDLPSETRELKTLDEYYGPGIVNKDWRYLNGVVISYQPRWTKGFTLGLTRVFQTYHEQLKLNSSLLNAYIPVFSTLFKAGTTNEDELGRDQLLSLFSRVVLPSRQFEFYLEYGINDHSFNLRDFVLAPSHSAAYITGFRKLFALPKKEFLDVNLEVTQLAQTPNAITREAANWYWHGVIYQGYSHLDQVIGAGVGPGNNVQTLRLNKRDGLKSLGLTIERMEHDPFYHNTKWTDLSIAVDKQLAIKRWLFSGTAQLIRSKDYLWISGKNIFNFLALLNSIYRF